MNLVQYIRKVIREAIMEDYRYQYDQEVGGFNPPSDVIGTVKRALEVVEKNKMIGHGGNEGSGIMKAKSISAGKPMNHSQLKRMKAFFDNNIESVKAERMGGKDIYSSAVIQKYELWGGDAGMQWCNREIGATQKTNQTSKKLRPKGTKTLMDPHNTRTHKANHFFTEIYEGDVALDDLFFKIFGDYFLENRKIIMDNVYSTLGCRTTNFAFESLCEDYPELENYQQEFYAAAQKEGYFVMNADKWSENNFD